MGVLRKIGFQPSSTLGVCDRVCGNRGDIREAMTWLHGQHKPNRNYVLANYAEFWRHGECVLGSADAPFNAVFDRNHGVVAAIGKDIVEGFADVVDADPFLALRIRNLPQGFPCECSHGAQVAIAFHSRCHRQSLVSTPIYVHVEWWQTGSATGEESYDRPPLR